MWASLQKEILFIVHSQQVELSYRMEGENDYEWKIWNEIQRIIRALF
jgi:hypothetical protein